MKILVIGTGGREHALVHTFWRQGHTVFCYPGNPGMLSQAFPLSSKLRLLDDYASLCQAVKEKGIDLTVVGSEVHLEKGIQDFFASNGHLLFGPSRLAARIESSKAWAKAFMAKYQIPTASFEICSSPTQAYQAARALFPRGKGVVVKASGLAGGKGVVCCSNYQEAADAIRQIAEEKIYGEAGSEVVVEEFISGPEISLQTISSGDEIFPLLAAQDHKRLLDQDQGPNTGGMGAYAPLPFLDANLQKEIDRTIVQPTLQGLIKEGIFYQGILYFGLMLTKEGPKVLEYNCRFGDPETQAILPLLETDLAETMMSALQGSLIPLRWKRNASCCVVVASKGYPSAFEQGHSIGSLQEQNDLFFFHAGTALNLEGKLITAGGRVLGVTSIGSDLEEAIGKAYAAIDRYSWSWAHCRRDIGRRALLSPA